MNDGLPLLHDGDKTQSGICEYYRIAQCRQIHLDERIIGTEVEHCYCQGADHQAQNNGDFKW